MCTLDAGRGAARAALAVGAAGRLRRRRGGSVRDRHDRVLAVGLRPAARLPEVRRGLRSSRTPG